MSSKIKHRRNSQSAWGMAGYRTSGYGFIFPSEQIEFRVSIRKHAFPKRPDAAISSMVKDTKAKVLALIEKDLKDANMYSIVRDAIDQLEFSAFIYLEEDVQENFARDAGDVVVTSYPDKIVLPSYIIFNEASNKTDTISVALTGYFYKK